MMYLTLFLRLLLLLLFIFDMTHTSYNRMEEPKYI